MADSARAVRTLTRRVARRFQTRSPISASWWLNPAADYAAEAARMRIQNVSSVHNLIAWKAVGTKIWVGAPSVGMGDL